MPSVNAIDPEGVVARVFFRRETQRAGALHLNIKVSHNRALLVGDKLIIESREAIQ